MNVLEKILEEIEAVRKIMKSTVATNCFGKECENDDCTVCVCERVIEIIRSHMNDETDTNVGSKSDWIPCGERLPEDDRMVLVTCQTKRGIRGVNRAYYDGMFWHGSGSMSRVIAWQPLPEPYKGEEAI